MSGPQRSLPRAIPPSDPGRRGDAVLVTGCSTGLGLETALALAEAGFVTYATVRDMGMESDVQAAAKARGVELRVLQLDLTDRATITAAVAEIKERSGGLFGLVNNGGIGLRGCLEDLPEDEIRHLFETNLMGTIAVTQAVLPIMRAAGRGRIITIGSVGGRISSFGVSVYCSSKFAQEGLAEALALEIAPFGLSSILVEPGIIKTTRWTVNRANSSTVRHPDSAYAQLFAAGEVLANRVVERSKTPPAAVGTAVLAALQDAKPRMRYVVGQPAGAAILARRYLPNRFFEKVYFGGLLKGLLKKAHELGPVTPAAPETPAAASLPADDTIAATHSEASGAVG